MAERDEDAALRRLGRDVHTARVEAGLTPPVDAGKAGQGMQAGFEFGGAVIVCTLIGVGLDKWLGTMPLFMLALLVLGFATGLWRAYRATTGK